MTTDVRADLYPTRRTAEMTTPARTRSSGPRPAPRARSP